MSNTDYQGSEVYLEDQLGKQYRGVVQTPLSVFQLDPSLQNTIANFDPNRIKSIEKLVLYKSILQIQAALDMRFLSVYELTLYFLHRTLAYNPTYAAVISVDPHCLEHAKAIDQKIVSGTPTTGIMGIPIWLKDNIATFGPLPTTGGAVALASCISIVDAPIVTALKASGAIVLGKTNLSEWANFMSTNSSNGYSVIGGQTQNPYGPFDVGGSSSGSAVAIALGLSPASVGTETCGSLVYPASQNGIVTFKPTHGTLSGEGILPIAASFDTAGPMGMHVQDAYITYVAMGGATPANCEPDFFHSTLARKRIGLIHSPALNDEIRAEDIKILTAIRVELELQGATVVDVHIPEAAFSMPLSEALHEEFELCLNNYFDFIGHKNALENIIQFNGESLETRAPFGQDLLMLSNEATTVIHSERTREMTEMSKNTLDRCLKEHQLDVIYHLSNHLAVLHAISGYPAITVPAGQRIHGEPIGVTFVSAPESVCSLFEIAHNYEAATHHFKPPTPWK